ncbi:MAG: RNA-binding cell elongation regulator Jag/EloR [Candidatus Binataceae bacterium]
MSPSDSIEATAPTVDQAIRQALEKLGAQEDDVEIEVLSTPRAGVLGLGVRQARVRVTRHAPATAQSGVQSPPPAPPPRSVRQPVAPATSSPPPRAPVPPTAPVTAAADSPHRRTPAERETGERERLDDRERERERQSGRRAERQVERPSNRTPRREDNDAAPGASTAVDREPEGDTGDAADRKPANLDEQVREASVILGRILELMNERTEIERVEVDLDTIELNIKGDGSGILIGRHGQTLDALEYLVNRLVARKIKDAVPISIDTESYRARRRRQLHRMALSKGEEAKREHVAVTLDPMPPRDRRIVHLALKDDPMITTRSSGDSFLRSIEIVPVDERRERGGREREHERRGRDQGQERDRERERDPDLAKEVPPGQQGGFKHGQKRIV